MGGVSNVDIDGNNSLYINTLGAAISTFETRPMRLFAHAAILSAGLPYHPELRRIWLLRGLAGFRKVSRVRSRRKQGQSAWSSGHHVVLP